MHAFRDRSYGAVWFLLGLFVVVGAVTWTGDMAATAQGALEVTREGVIRGEVWRLVTYAFLTGGPLSLIFTLLVFYYIAAPLEAAWGTRRFLTLFAVSVIGGGLTGALVNAPLAGGWAPTMTLMLIHGFMFPDSVIYLFFILPIRVKTLAIVLTALYLAGCTVMGLKGLAFFAGLFCGVIYYVLVTRSIPWVRKAKHRIVETAANPMNAIRNYSTTRMMEEARQIMRRRDSGSPLTPEDRSLIEELIKRSDPGEELCSPYSFSPDNTICPPCRQFGRCLRRYLQAAEEDAAESKPTGSRAS